MSKRWSIVYSQALPARASDANGRLTITQVRREDSGLYICSAIGIDGNFRATGRLRVERSKYLGTRSPTLYRLNKLFQYFSLNPILSTHYLFSMALIQ